MNKLFAFIPGVVDLQITDVKHGLSMDLGKGLFDAILGGDCYHFCPPDCYAPHKGAENLIKLNVS